MKKKDETLRLPKRGIWGGYTIQRIGPKNKGYYWIGEGTKYLMALTFAEAKKLSEFLK